MNSNLRVRGRVHLQGVEWLEGRQMLTADLVSPGDVAADDSSVVSVAGETAAATDVNRLGATADVQVILPTQFAETAVVELIVNGESLTLQPERYSVRSENFKVVLRHADGTATEFDAGEDKTYLGTIDELPDVLVRALRTVDGLEVTAIDASTDEVLWQLAPTGSGYEITLPSDKPIDFGDDALLHDHDRDGIADHTAAEHKDGCCCAQCLAAVAAPASDSTTVRVEPLTASTANSNTHGSSPAIAAGPGDAVVLNPVTIRHAELAFDVTYEAFSGIYGSNVQAVMDNINRILSVTVDARLNTIWVRDVLVEHVLGRVEIRMSAAADPYLQQGLSNRSGTDSATLNAFRNEWQSGAYGTTHDLAHMITRGGGGLAWVGTAGNNNSRRYSQGGGSQDFWRGIVRHEIGHTWGLNHGHGGIDFGAPTLDGSVNPTFSYGIMRGALSNRMNPPEQATVAARVASAAGTLANTNQPYDPNVNIRPYAKLDTFDLAAPAGGPSTYMLDVLDNDHDANNDPIYIESVVGGGTTVTSPQGSVLTIGNGMGDRGQDVLLYTPGAGVTEEKLFYFVRDVRASGSHNNYGQIDITVDDPRIFVDVAKDIYNYDPGTRTSPIFSGATQLSPDTYGDVNWNVPVQAADTDLGNAYNQDYIFNDQAATLSHKVQNGRWQVLVNMSDATSNLDNMFIEAEGQALVSNIDRPIGQNTNIIFQVDVLDGELDLTFGDADPTNKRWAVNRIVLTQIEEYIPPILEGDYNGNGIVDAADFTAWRDALGSTVARPFAGADGNGNGIVDEGDYGVWRDHFGNALVTTPLIDATTGNGEFAIDSTDGISIIGGGSDSPTIQLNRDRAFRLSGDPPGRGIAVPGWEIVRVSYPGANNAFGVDGTFGFAPDAGTGPGQTGQAFVNSGEISVTSNTIMGDFNEGNQIDLSYLLGSDSGGATATVEADVSLIFDEGLLTERTVTFGTRTGTGIVFTPLMESHRLTTPVSSIAVRFDLNGINSGIRALLDRVELAVASSSANIPDLGGHPNTEDGGLVQDGADQADTLPAIAAPQPLSRYFPLPRPASSRSILTESGSAFVESSSVDAALDDHPLLFQAAPGPAGEDMNSLFAASNDEEIEAIFVALDLEDAGLFKFG